MATCEKEIERNLSDDLSLKQSKKEPSFCEEKDAVMEDKNETKNCTKDCDLDGNEGSDLANNDLEFTSKKDKRSQNGKQSVNCNTSSTVNEVIKNKGEDCNSSEGAKLDEFSKNRQPSPRSGGRRVDEALLEEDEMAEGCEEDEEEHYESAEEHLTPEEAEERMKEALELKKEGNDHFRKQEYFKGKDLYTKAIKRCPKEFTENKSIFYANRAACFQKLEEYENAVSDCNEALELAPNYLKARLRRAQCYEKVDKLEEALEDYKIVFENDKSCQPAREAILRLPEEIKVKHEKLKEEMIGKLKELGNMVLRPFGLSTDNFKVQQDPNSGGYSINFQK